MVRYILRSAQNTHHERWYIVLPLMLSVFVEDKNVSKQMSGMIFFMKNVYTKDT